MMLPDAIDQDAGKQRILRRSHPACEGATSSAADTPLGLRFQTVNVAGCTQGGRHAGLYFSSRSVVQTTPQNVMHRRMRVGLDQYREFFQRRFAFGAFAECYHAVVGLDPALGAIRRKKNGLEAVIL